MSKKPAKRRLGKGLSAMLDTAKAAQPVAIKESPDAKTQPHSSPANLDKADQSASSVLLSDDVSASGNHSEAAGNAVSAQQMGVLRIPIEAIHPGAHQPRRSFDDGALESLAASIRSVGVIQPITVRPDVEGGYELIAGERRWRASKIAGLKDIPALVVEADEQTAAETALIENLQREDLNPIERGDAIRRLIDRFGFSQSVVAERVGLDRSSVSNLLRLSELEEPIREMLVSGLLGLGHGKALLAVPPGNSRVELAARASREGLSVRRLEEETRRLKDQNPAPAASDRSSERSAVVGDVEVRALEKRLGEHLGTKVSIRVDRSGKGVVQIRFFDLDHFDDLMSRIRFDASDTAR